jgi:hypothetical protein
LDPRLRCPVVSERFGLAARSTAVPTTLRDNARHGCTSV